MPPLMWKIILGIALGVVILRGGGPALLRFALPIAIVYFGYKFLQRLAAQKLGDFAARMRDAQRDAAAGPQHQKTIEICAECGHPKSTQSCTSCR